MITFKEVTEMAKRKATAKENRVKRQFKGRFDKIIDTYDCGDFVEITGRIGGDVITYRVYNDGRICER